MSLSLLPPSLPYSLPYSLADSSLPYSPPMFLNEVSKNVLQQPLFSIKSTEYKAISKELAKKIGFKYVPLKPDGNPDRDFMHALIRLNFIYKNLENIEGSKELEDALQYFFDDSIVVDEHDESVQNIKKMDKKFKKLLTKDQKFLQKCKKHVKDVEEIIELYKDLEKKIEDFKQKTQIGGANIGLNMDESYKQKTTAEQKFNEKFESMYGKPETPFLWKLFGYHYNPRRVSKSVGKPRRVSKSVGKSRRVSKSVGKPRRVSKSVGKPRRVSKSVYKPRRVSKSVGKSKRVLKYVRKHKQ